MICIVCKNDVKLEDEKFQVALDVPYFNLKLHKECYREIKEFLSNFLSQHIEMVYNIIREENNKKHVRIRRNSTN